MPGLETKGNIIENFGHYYPTPIIELIEVLPTGFEVTVCMYFNFSTGVTEEEVQALLGKPAVFDSDGVETSSRQAGSLDDLQIYVFYVLGKPYADDLINRKTTNIWSELVLKKPGSVPFYRDETPLDAEYQGWTSQYRLPDGVGNYLRKPFTEWELDEEIYYDTNNNRMYKYYTKFEMTNLFKDDEFNLDDRIPFNGDPDETTYLFGWEAAMAIHGTSTQSTTQSTSGGGGNGSPTNNSSNGSSTTFIGGKLPLYPELGGQLTLFSFSSTVNIENFKQGAWIHAAYELPGEAPFGAYALYKVPWEGYYSTYGAVDQAGSRLYEYITPALNESLIKKQFSDISYEIVFRNGMINTADDLAYIDPDGHVYNAVPFKSLSGTYHKQGAVVHDQVIDLFNEMLFSYYDEGNEKIMKVVDTVSYILATAGHTVDILPKLEGYRVTYSADTDPTTTTGAFYQSYKDLILSINAQILTGETLEKQLLKNLKIADARVQRLPTTSWVHTAQQDTAYDNSLYCLGPHKHGLMEVEYEWGGATSNGVMSPNTAENLPSRIMKRGYFFFDAEKELRSKSAFSQLYDVNVAAYLIPDIKSALNTHFQVINASYYCLQASGFSGNPFTESRFINEIPTNNHASYSDTSNNSQKIELVDSHTQWFTNKGRYNSGTGTYMYTNMPRPLTWQMDWQLQYDTGGDESSPGVVRYENPNYTATISSPATAMQIGAQYSYIINRSFDTISTSQYPSVLTWPLQPTIDYNLWCFEFQDIQTTMESTAAEVQNQAYAFGATALDTTLTVVDQLTGSFYDAFLEFQEYYQLAQDNCAYGDAISAMNEEFVEFAANHWSGYDTDRKPWNLAPLVFHTHLELLYRHYSEYDADSSYAYGPNMEKLVEAISRDIALLQPESTTFYNIERFYQDCQNLWNQNYSAQGGSDFYNAYTNQTREQRLTYGYDGTAAHTTHFYAPMPDVMEVRPVYTNVALEGHIETLDFWTNSSSTSNSPRWKDLIDGNNNLNTANQNIVDAAIQQLGAEITKMLTIRGTSSGAREDIELTTGYGTDVLAEATTSLSWAMILLEELPTLNIQDPTWASVIYGIFAEGGRGGDLKDLIKQQFINNISAALDFDMDWGDPLEDFEQIIVQTMAVVDSYLNGIVDRLINEGFTFSTWTGTLGLTSEDALTMITLYEWSNT